MNKYYSQYQQDKFLNEVLFRSKKNGVFVDIGANDGVTISNSYFFEKNLYWTGICFEPLIEAFNKLEKNRSSVNINGCASDRNHLDIFYNVHGYGEMLSGLKSKYDERHIERINKTIKEYGGHITETKVQCFDVNDILEENGIKKIDFVSIDTEGGELNILHAIDFDAFKIKAVVVENNYSTPDIFHFMSSKGYFRVAYLSTDEIYLHPRYYGYLSAFIIRCRIKFTKLGSKFNTVSH
ncbi:FkbM family methyltransferase [Mucilaginibacter sp. cycad4]|uniref:FkbM family methyltransferase n=1 Tax=Mucilaginibacter sp. cycad4 TaxID=3342096 RepID=UPI002AABEA54|nr:FkbM family methyltransferase [Mucilaginibacter gossypii]WPU98346.1 FkbM family methyltransferase [Mucilaginibacter gossypii]